MNTTGVTRMHRFVRRLRAATTAAQGSITRSLRLSHPWLAVAVEEFVRCLVTKCGKAQLQAGGGITCPSTGAVASMPNEPHCTNTLESEEDSEGRTVLVKQCEALLPAPPLMPLRDQFREMTGNLSARHSVQPGGAMRQLRFNRTAQNTIGTGRRSTLRPRVMFQKAWPVSRTCLRVLVHSAPSAQNDGLLASIVK